MGVINIYGMNPVFLQESAVQDINLTPPGGRWKAVHNLHTTDLNVLAPSNEIYKYTAEDAGARSNYHTPLNSGKLDEDTPLDQFSGTVTTVDAGTTGAFGTGDSSGTVTVTRSGKAAHGVTVPSFDGITWDGTDLLTLVVNGEGAGLEEGDVITFPLTTNSDITVTFTVAEDDLKLGAGLNILKSTAMAVAVVIPAGETVALPSFSKIQIQAADDGDDADAVAYYN